MDLRHVADSIERDFEVRRIHHGCAHRAILAYALRRPERAACAACERVTLAQSIEDLPADAPRGVGAE
jgi:hypothetical protein